MEVLPRKGKANLQYPAEKIERSADASEARPWASLSFPRRNGSKPSGDRWDKSPLMAWKDGNCYRLSDLQREGLANRPDFD